MTRASLERSLELAQQCRILERDRHLARHELFQPRSAPTSGQFCS